MAMQHWVTWMRDGKQFKALVSVHFGNPARAEYEWEANVFGEVLAVIDEDGAQIFSADPEVEAV